MIIYTPPADAPVLPVIDFSPSFSPNLADRREVAREVHKAARHTGFFYAAGHGIPQAVLDAQLDWTWRLFAMPDGEKQALSITNSNCMRGYERMALQTLDVGSPPDLKESFMLGRDLAPDHAYVRRGVPNHGPNQWPDNLAGFRGQIQSYQAHVEALGKHLMRCLALSLDLPESQFDDGFDEPMCTVRLLHYPPHPASAADNQLGAGAHTDWGSITMLLQDHNGGLEVRNAAGEWIRATPIPGTFVVNLGDMVRRWTNDLYHSTLHRVRNESGRDRYSIAAFFNPDFFYQVECLPTCRSADAPPIYSTCTVGEHIDEMFRITYGGKPQRNAAPQASPAS
jgi:isopenicillin N synthase-like dioxygenase